MSINRNLQSNCNTCPTTPQCPPSLNLSLPPHLLPQPPKAFQINLDFSKIPLLKNLRGYSTIIDPTIGGNNTISIEGSVEALNGNIIKAKSTSTANTLVTATILTDGSTEYNISLDIPLRVNGNIISVPLSPKKGYNFATADMAGVYGITSGHIPVNFYSGTGTQAGDIWGSIPSLSPNNYVTRNAGIATPTIVNVPSAGTLELNAIDSSLLVFGSDSNDSIGYRVQISTASGNQLIVNPNTSSNPGLYVSSGASSRQYKTTNFNGSSIAITTPSNLDLNFKSLDNGLTILGNDANDEIGIGLRVDSNPSNLLSITNNGLFASYNPIYVNTNVSSSVTTLDTTPSFTSLPLGSVAIWDNNTNPTGGTWVRRISTSGSNQWEIIGTNSTSSGGGFIVNTVGGTPQTILPGDTLSVTNTDNLVLVNTINNDNLSINLSPNVMTNSDSINKLNDVIISSPTPGQTLVWNGSQFVNTTPLINFNVTGDAGSPATLSNSDTIQLDGVNGITTSITTMGTTKQVKFALDIKVEEFDKNSGNTVTLSENPNTYSHFLVYRNGLLQRQGSINGDYTVSNNIITFNQGLTAFGTPANSEWIFVEYVVA